MVKQASRTFGIALAGLSLGACPVGADSILEQMQNEVATVAGKARVCIVTIEDARAIAISYNNSTLEKSDLQNQIAHAEIDRKAAQALATQSEQRYKAGLITALQVEKPRRELARLDTRLTYLQQKLANLGREDTTTQLKHDLDAHIAELEIDQKFYNDQVKLLAQQVAVGTGDMPELQASQQQQAHVLQDLTAAREQRKVWDQNTQNPTVFRWNNFQFNTPKSGSGFSVGDGYIVTTADVVQGMSSPIVTADDGRRIRAMLVAVDDERNVGLVRLAANTTLPALTLGDSDRVMPGHFAISIGNQAGQYNSVALGLVSGIRPQGFYSGEHFYPNLLQVDGAVGAGTSGAPILNNRGEVIGMIAAVAAPETTPSATSSYVDVSFQDMSTLPALSVNGATPQSETHNSSVTFSRNSNAGRSVSGNRGASVSAPNSPMNFSNNLPGSIQSFFTPRQMQSMAAPRPLTAGAGTGFAIPINEIKGVIEELKTGKNIVHAWLGVALDDVDNVKEENGTIRLNRQVRVRGVYADSPAAKTGVKAGDVIVNLEDKPVHTTRDVRAAILPLKSGQKVSIVVQRAAKPIALNLTLELQPTPRPALLPNGPVFPLQAPAQAERKKSGANP